MGGQHPDLTLSGKFLRFLPDSLEYATESGEWKGRRHSRYRGVERELPMPTCSCGRAMVAITMTTPEAPVSLLSCGSCDRVEWKVDGHEVDRTRALDQLATTGRRR